MTGLRLGAAASILVGLLGASASPAWAQQDSSCTWDRCALRVQDGFPGEQLVRGRNDVKVAAGLAVGGITVVLVGGAMSISAHNHLSRAVWWYNRTLVAPGLPSDPSGGLASARVRVGISGAAW